MQLSGKMFLPLARCLMTYILKVQKDKKTKNLFIKLPSKLMKDMNWKIGDSLQWVDNKDGSYTLEKNER